MGSDANQGTKNSLDRKCKNSEPFLIKNEKKRKAYLTVDVETAVVSGGKKNGEHGDDGVVDGTGTLFGSSMTDGTSGFGRLMKRSPGLRIVPEVNLKVGTSIIQDWFLWGIENV